MTHFTPPLRKILVVVTAVLTFGCNETGTDGKIDPNDLKITVDPATIEMGPEAASKTFTVTAPIDWTIKGAAEWCTVEPSSGGKGTTEVTVSLAANTTDDDRSCTLTIESATSKSDPIKVVQTAKKDEFVKISDPNFLAYLTSAKNIVFDESTKSWVDSSTKIDADGDGQISRVEAEAITGIHVNTDNIASVAEITQMPHLQYLDCSGSNGGDGAYYNIISNGKLTSIDVSKNPELKYFRCYANKLTSIDISNNTELYDFNCYGNLIQSIDFSNNTKLQKIGLCAILLTSLDVSMCPELNWLNCGYNFLSELDVTANTKLMWLYCYEQLSPQAASAPRKVGSRSNDSSEHEFARFNTIEEEMVLCDNPMLLPDKNAVELSKAARSPRRAESAQGGLTSLDLSKNTQLTELLCSTNQLTTLDVSNNTLLTNLSCNGNKITTLDISNNTKLNALYCHNNQLTTLDITNNTELATVHCYNNQLATLDFSKNTSLTELWCNDNQLTTLDVSNNTALTTLVCYYNQLETLDVSKNTALILFNCYHNKLTSLDLSSNTALEHLDFEENQLTSLDLSNNKKLGILYCTNNRLETLDLSQNALLNLLYCSGNRLSVLDISPTAITTELNCSPMNDAEEKNLLETLWINTNQEQHKNSWKVPAGTTIALKGQGGGNDEIIPVSDPNFLAYLTSAKNIVFDESTKSWVDSSTKIDADGDGQISRAEAEAITGIKVCTDNIASITETALMPNLQYLECCGSSSGEYDNLICYGILTSIDVSKNSELKVFYCYGNKLTAIDISNNTSLTELWCYNNQLASLNVSNNTLLTKLYCYTNQLTTLDVSKNTELVNLYCYENQLKSLDVSNNTLLSILWCEKNQLSTLDVSKNTELTILWCGHSQLTTLDVSKNTKLTELVCYNNQLETLDLSKNTALVGLYCDDNQFSTLDLSNNTKLAALSCDSNQLTSLGLSNNTSLAVLDCSDNRLSVLDISPTAITNDLYCNPMNDAEGKNLLETLWISSNQEQYKNGWEVPAETVITVK